MAAPVDLPPPHTLPDPAAARRAVGQVAAAGPFRPTWESLEQYRVPGWYQDAKFGIFIHWGVYSVPAFGNEWYPRNMYRRETKEFRHHLETHGDHRRFGYKDFIPMFRAEHFDPDAWAALFRRAGAKFVVPVAEHHDGFALHASAYSDWTAARMGPRRDLIGELAAAIRRQWMVFGVSSHRAEHWWFFDAGTTFDSDVRDPRNAGLYGPAHPEHLPPTEAFLDDWLLRTCELVDRYEPQLIWFDWWIGQPAFREYLQTFAAYYYNRAVQWGRGVAINYKYTAFPDRVAVLDVERGQLDHLRPLFWQTDTSVSRNSWGYVADQDYKSAGEIIRDLADIVSKNGALLLNIGPRADGTIVQAEQDILTEIGDWLTVNGEAIYGTRPWRSFGEGPTEVAGGAFTDTRRAAFTPRDVRFTTRGDVLYAIVLAWPEGDPGEVTVRSLASGSGLFPRAVAKVELLGVPGTLEHRRDAAGLTVALPAARPCRHAFTLRVTPAPRQ